MASKEPLLRPMTHHDVDVSNFKSSATTKRSEKISPPKLVLDSLPAEFNHIVQPSINSPILIPIKPLFQRLVHKDGSPGTLVHSLKAQRGKAYAFDVYTTLIDCKWWLFILLVVATYMISYSFFAALWYGASLIPDSDEPNKTCVQGVTDVLSAFFLSIEVQSTIGFGFRQPRSDPHCVLGFFILFAQSVVGLFIDAFYLALIVTKISRPYRRKATIMFSKTASVFRENGKWFFSFRVTDLRKVKLVEPHIKLYLFHLTRCEGEGVAFMCQNLDVGYDTGVDRLQMILPTEVQHEISPSSPLYQLSPQQLREENYELVAVLEGIVEGTGATAQVMTSYRGSEIDFGYRFTNVLKLVSNKVVIDLTKFHTLKMMEDYPCDKSIGDLQDCSTEI